jgi:hypothetical protein
MYKQEMQQKLPPNVESKHGPSIAPRPCFPTPLFHQHLLLLLQLLNKANWNLKSLCDDIGRSKGKPLGQGDICHTIGLVDLDPDKVLGI